MKVDHAICEISTSNLVYTLLNNTDQYANHLLILNLYN